MTMAEKLSEGFVIFVIGILVVFSVLMILWAILAIFRVVFYDIPNKNKGIAKPVKKEKPVKEVKKEVKVEVKEEDDLELIAVITAAIASMTGKSANGFKIKSIKRVSKWNKV